MCRILLVRNKEMFDPSIYLQKFSLMARKSKEYQGDGWGYAYWMKNHWVPYKSVNPIWEESFDNFPLTNLLIAHARSSFNNTGPDIDSTMPFIRSSKAFIFNGELRKVRLSSKGKTGAEKLFNFIIRLERGDLYDATKKAMNIIQDRTDYIRAANFIIADNKLALIFSLYNEDRDYFTLWQFKDENGFIICSEPLDTNIGWNSFSNEYFQVINYSSY
ncbi:MAG: class II glutamine amidotransferase [Candidatus Thorarchaeota archaeon]